MTAGRRESEAFTVSYTDQTLQKCHMTAPGERIRSYDAHIARYARLPRKRILNTNEAL